jgi:hypothetical protein
VNKKILGLAVTLITVAMLATPVLAIGPENAIGKNPNLIGPSPWGFDMVLDNGVVHGWIVYVYPVPKLDWLLDAGQFKIKNAFVVTDPIQVLGMENKWLFLSPDVYYDLLVNIYGVPPSFAEYLLSMHPQGVYNKWNFVGQ